MPARLGWLKIPVVRLAHHKINRGRLSLLRAPFVKLSVKGTDIFPSLSSRVANEISVISRQPQKSFPIPWGPDAKFYSRSSHQWISQNTTPEKAKYLIQTALQ